MLLYIIRHADPIYNPDSLTELGHKQAQALAPRLAVNGLDKIYSSPNMRAQMTAKPTSELLGLEYTIENWMSEDLAWKNFSYVNEDGNRDWTFNRQNTKIKYDESIKSSGDWQNSEYFKITNAKEGYKNITECSDDFTKRLGYEHVGGMYKIIKASTERVAAFCHHGLGTIWLSYLLDIPLNIFSTSFNISHSGVTILEFQNYEDGYTAPRCLCLSDISHIYQAGLPMKYNNHLDI